MYTDQSGNKQQATGDYCICTIPLPVLKNIPSDFSPNLQDAIDQGGSQYARAGKSGLQFNRRFWEEDERVFGGITWTDQDIVQLWYPSDGYLTKKGVIVGYYQFDDTVVGPQAPDKRLAIALEQGGKIHPQYKDSFENGVTLYWPKIPYNLGGWAAYSNDFLNNYYPRLTQPDGNIYLCGEHVSYITGWQAGALESARLVAQKINALS